MTKDKAMAATLHTELIAELMNPNNPKNEREHAAVREIERLQEALEQPWPDLNKRDRESYQKGHNDGVAHHKQSVKAAQPEQERSTSKRIAPYSTTLSSLLNSPAHKLKEQTK